MNQGKKLKKPTYYLASGLSNKAEAAATIAALNAYGLECVYDWTVADDSGESIREMVKAVKRCDVFVLMPPYKRGAATELGVALAMGIPVVMYNGTMDDFHDFPLATKAVWAGNLPFLVECVREHSGYPRQDISEDREAAVKNGAWDTLSTKAMRWLGGKDREGTPGGELVAALKASCLGAYYEGELFRAAFSISGCGDIPTFMAVVSQAGRAVREHEAKK